MKLQTLLLSLSLAVLASAAAAKSSPSTSTVYQFPQPKAWAENLATRSDGLILISRADVPELWSVDPVKHTASLIYTFPNATALLGIEEIGVDEYALIALSRTATGAAVANSTSIRKIDLKTKPQPTSSTLAAIPEIIFGNGLARLGDYLLISDSFGGVIYRVNTCTGAYSVALNDPKTMLPISDGNPGINGVRTLGDYVYYSNTGRKLLMRVRVDSQVRPVGPYEVITTGIAIDDFAVDPSGIAYVAGNTINQVFQVTPDGKQTVLAGSLGSLAVPGPTSCQLAKGWDSRSTLFCSTDGGQAGPVNGTLTVPGTVVMINL